MSAQKAKNFSVNNKFFNYSPYFFFMAEEEGEEWIYGDLGFDTQKKLWFIDLYSPKGPAGVIFAKSVVLINGSGHQYQWTDQRGAWHIRERIYKEDVEKLLLEGSELKIFFKISNYTAEVPEDYDYLTYAYSLKNGMGFIEFYKGDKMIKKIRDKYIIVSDLNHRTIGKYPNIRLRAEKTDVSSIIVTKTAILILGRVGETNDKPL